MKFDKEILKRRQWRSEESLGIRVGDFGRFFLALNPREAKKGKIVLAWSEIVGSALARITEAVALKNGVLVVNLYEPSWRTELEFQKQKILEKFYQRYEKEAPTEIKFTYAKRQVERPSPEGKKGAPLPQLPEALLNQLTSHDEFLTKKFRSLRQLSEAHAPYAPAEAVQKEEKKYSPSHDGTSLFFVNSHFFDEQ